MKPSETRILKILEVIDGHAQLTSQRELARSLRVSTGLINTFVRKLIKKGFVKIESLSKNRVRYLLTPAGFYEKSRLTCRYVRNSYIEYKKACHKIENLYAELEKQKVSSLAFYGLSETANLAFNLLIDTSISFAGMFDDDHAGEIFLNNRILTTEDLNIATCDRILITDMDKYLSKRQFFNQRSMIAKTVYL